MQIPCPWCGLRPLDEFAYGGDATKKRPTGKRQADTSAWVDYVYIHDNPAGRHREYWQHVGGCRSWIVITRDTTNHAISKAELAPPDSRGGRR